MAIVMPVAIEAITLSSRIGVAAERKRVAVQLADRMLSEMVATDEWSQGDRSGTFEDWPGYRWEMQVETWSEDPMEEVSVEVFYQVQGREYRERLSTLARPAEESTRTDGTTQP
jgi:hypothetical protein